MELDENFNKYSALSEELLNLVCFNIVMSCYSNSKNELDWNWKLGECSCEPAICNTREIIPSAKS